MEKIIIGAREWCSLPNLGIQLIKAKIDSGAKTTALHADDMTKFHKGDENWIRFSLHPLKSKPEFIVTCEAKVLETRMVKSSNGSKEERYVIETDIILGKDRYPIEITLTNRRLMGFQMLLGRQAMNGRNLIDCEKRYVIGKPIV